MPGLRLLPAIGDAEPPAPNAETPRHGELLNGPFGLVPMPLPPAAGFTVPRAVHARLVAATRWSAPPVVIDLQLPDLLVVGCEPGYEDLGPAEHTTGELDQHGLLLGVLRRAARAGNTVGIAAVATRNALLNQRFRPVPLLPDLIGTAASCDALGVQVAQSGTVAGLLYDGADPRAAARADRARAELAGLGVGRTWVFRSSTPALARAVGE